MYLVHELIGPVYETSSRLQVEPAATPPIYSTSTQGGMELGRAGDAYLQTQVNRITGNDVLDEALAHPSVINFPIIRHSKDPKTDVKKKLTVEIVDKKTYLIEVKMESSIPEEAAAIVNAVVDAYLHYQKDYHEGKNRDLRVSYVKQVEKLGKEINSKRTQLEALVRRGTVDVVRPILSLPETTGKNADSLSQPTLTPISVGDYKRLVASFMDAEVELISAQAGLEAARNVPQTVRSAAEVKKDAEVAALADINQRIAEREDQRIRDLKIAVEKAKRKKVGLAKFMENVKVEMQEKNVNDNLAYSLEERELQILQGNQQVLRDKLDQLEFESNQEHYRISRVYKAEVPPEDNGKLLKYMAVVPVGILFLVLGWFLVGEIRSRRHRAVDILLRAKADGSLLEL
jgi:hypothetical protein